jgi:hypothetical protein
MHLQPLGPGNPGEESSKFRRISPAGQLAGQVGELLPPWPPQAPNSTTMTQARMAMGKRIICNPYHAAPLRTRSVPACPVSVDSAKGSGMKRVGYLRWGERIHTSPSKSEVIAAIERNMGRTEASSSEWA